MRIHPLRTLSQLESLTPQQLDRMTRQAVRQLSTRKLLLGRCLVALDRERRARKLGFSSSIHYARLLGVEYREALEVRRVARRLEELPKLRAAAEEGAVPWASLREIVRKANAATEARWLDFVGRKTYRQIEKMVRATKSGEMPCESALASEIPSLEVMLRILTSHIGEAMFEKVARDVAEKRGGAITLGETLEWLCVHYMTGLSTQKARDRFTQEILKDIAAEFANTAPEQAPSADELPARVISSDLEGSDLTVLHWQNDRLRFRPDARLTPAQRREILRRDGYCCSTPGCPNRLWLDAHHIIFFSQGGPSLPANILILCSACHGNLHHNYLSVVGEAPFDLFWFGPDDHPLIWPRLNELEAEEQRILNDELYRPVKDGPSDLG